MAGARIAALAGGALDDAEMPEAHDLHFGAFLERRRDGFEGRIDGGRRRGLGHVGPAGHRRDQLVLRHRKIPSSLLPRISGDLRDERLPKSGELQAARRFRPNQAVAARPWRSRWPIASTRSPYARSTTSSIEGVLANMAEARARISSRLGSCGRPISVSTWTAECRACASFSCSAARSDVPTAAAIASAM